MNIMASGQASLEYLLITAGVLIVAAIVGSAIMNAATSTAITTSGGSSIAVNPNPGRLAFWKDWNTLSYVPGSLVSSTSIYIDGSFSAKGVISAGQFCLPSGCIGDWNDVNKYIPPSISGSVSIPQNLVVNSLDANYVSIKQRICLNGTCITSWPAGGAAPLPIEAGKTMISIKGTHIPNTMFCSQGFPFLDGITEFSEEYTYAAYVCEELTGTGSVLYGGYVAKLDRTGKVVQKWKLPRSPSAITQIAEINGVVYFAEDNSFAYSGINIYALDTATGNTTKILSKNKVNAVGSCGGYLLVSDGQAGDTEVYIVSGTTATKISTITGIAPMFIYCFPGSNYALLYDGTTVEVVNVAAGNVVFKTTGTLLKPYGDKFAVYHSSTGMLAGYKFNGASVELTGFGPLSTLPSGGYELQDYFCTSGWLWTWDGAPAGTCPNLNQLVQGTGARYLARFAVTGNAIVGGTLSGITYYSP